MFDNLREQPDSAPFDSTPFYEDEAQFEEAERRPMASPRRRAAGSNGRLLGMTPMQRFLLAFMLFMAVCTLGAMLLLVAEKISLF